MAVHQRQFSFFRSLISLAIVEIVMISPTAFADDGSHGTPNFMMHWDASGDSNPNFIFNPSNFATIPTAHGTHWQLGSGTSGVGGPARERAGWRYRGGLSDELWALNWDCVVNADPYIDATISITNHSSAFQAISLYMPLDIATPIMDATLMSGLVSATVNDSDFSGGVVLKTTPNDCVF